MNSINYFLQTNTFNLAMGKNTKKFEKVIYEIIIYRYILISCGGNLVDVLMYYTYKFS